MRTFTGRDWYPILVNPIWGGLDFDELDATEVNGPGRSPDIVASAFTASRLGSHMVFNSLANFNTITVRFEQALITVRPEKNTIIVERRRAA